VDGAGFTGPPLTVSPWEYAGLLLTYWCNARCAFCYVYSGPDRGGQMSIETAVALWHGLVEHAAAHGKSMRVHLSGGEPFGDWPQLAGLLRAARDAGLSPAEKVETNAFWATDDDLTRARLELLCAFGVGKLVISTDVYHQEFVPFERVRRCVRIAREVLGRRRVQVRWADFLRRPEELRLMLAADRHAAYRAALRRHRDRLTGRAADVVAPLLEARPADSFRGQNCARAILQSRHVHIDAYGHVFPGVCSGIILGKAGSNSIDELWNRFSSAWQENPVLKALVVGGSYDLLGLAKSFGYKELPQGYADRCHLCAHVRQYLFAKGIWPDLIGPAECYGQVRNGSSQPAPGKLKHVGPQPAT
jgi:hypothetical protein